MTTEPVTTTYLGFTVLVEHDGFTVLDRNGEPVVTPTKLRTMAGARAVVSALRRAERESA